MSTPGHPGSFPQRSLAAAGLPRRVRSALEQSLTLVSTALDGSLGEMLAEFEQALYRLASQARSPGSESGYMQTLRTFRVNRSDLVPHFMLALETALAGIRSPTDPAAAPAAKTVGGTIGFGRLSLVEESEMDEETVLREIASRQESRANLALHLLGQRFGVLAAAPAFDAERIPLGPQSLCRALRTAGEALQIERDSRLLLYRSFDRQVMGGYAKVLERLDQLLDREGVLPGLTYVPVRIRPTPVDPGAASDDARKALEGAAVRRSAEDAHRPHTAWMGEAQDASGEDEQVAARTLAQLLASRRDLLGKLRPAGQAATQRDLLRSDALVSALGALQAQGGASRSGEPPGLTDIKQTLLAQARQRSGAGVELSQQDSDTFELLGMLYKHLDEDIRRDAPAAGLVRRLQIPLLRAALQDHGFFVRAHHPARQLLGTIAEHAAGWLDDTDFDPQLLRPLQQAVDRVVEQYDGDPAVFVKANEQLQAHLQAQVRKADLLERRHTEAARGREKLEVAKLRAGEVMDGILDGQRVPKFTRTLLGQAWADVLTLTLLRQGEDSEAWRAQLDATRRILQACTREDAAADPALAEHVEAALGQVGYHADEAAAIARRLTSAASAAGDDPGSRTELAMKLKSRVRLGEDSRQDKPAPPPRSPEEQARYEQLRTLPFGTWIEFLVNQQGDVVRRRLSWFSPVTDNALFVNQRGQRIGEQSLDAVARLLTSGQARIVTVDRGRLVDRAWQAAISALRSFAGLGDGARPAAKDGP